MDNGFAFADLIILALVAGFILLRLRGMLGNHAEPPEQKPKSFQRNPQERDDQPPLAQRPAPIEKEPEEPVETYAGDDKALATALKKIRAADPSFHAGKFLEGSKSAFEMVLDAYGSGDLKTLKLLLADDIFNDFADVIKRHKRDQIEEKTTLIAITSATIRDAVYRDTTASISVEFVTEQISVTRDKDGEVIAGDPSRIERVRDVWTFERDTRSQDPNWKLTNTEG